VKKNKYPLITIVSLFSARWASLSFYLQGLKTLDYPKDRLRLLWYCCANEVFFDTLKIISESLKGYEDKQVIHDDSIPISPIAHAEINFKEDAEVQLMNYILQLNTIAALYNAVFSYVKTDYVFSLEDDILAQPQNLKNLLSIIESHPKAVEAIAAIQCRHNKDTIVLWDLKQAPQYHRGKIKMVKVLTPVAKPWGIRKVAAGNLGAALFKRSRCPKVFKKKGGPFRASEKPRNFDKPYGVDNLIALDIWKYGGEVYGSFEDRPYHISSQAMAG